MAIRVRGAAEHNLRDIDVGFGGGLTVVTGVSGSGKTSLVFDTLYHEARRRFLDVFTLGSSRLRLAPARVKAIEGLGPAVAVGQNLLNRNPGSTLATASGLHPFLRVLYARFGTRHCPRCGAGLVLLTEDEIVERLTAMGRKSDLVISVPLVRHAKGSHATLLQLLQSEFGLAALAVDGVQGEQPGALDPRQPHDIEVEIARLVAPAPLASIRRAVETASTTGAQALTVFSGGRRDSGLTWARAPACGSCDYWFGDLEPAHFHAPCPHCRGRGCAQCEGSGLYPEALAVRWEGLRIPELLAQTVEDALPLFARADLPFTAARVKAEIERRLDALHRVGLGYIALDRLSPTLSRGEAQRVRLAVALTSRLEDMLHVLDEPTIGQHPADVAKVLPSLRELAGPVVYVEHDRYAASVADLAVDLGPGAGPQGGRLLFTGTPAELWRADTTTGRYFSGQERVSAPAMRREPEQFLTIRGACLRNLKGIDVRIPLGRLTVIAGVSGSGKSTLVEDVLVPSLAGDRLVGCQAIEGPTLRPVLVDQSPIGKNPRSNPATYTDLAVILRDHLAAMTGLTPSHFSFNRAEGACPACEGMGAVEVQLRYLPSTWIPCAVCEGHRFSEKVLLARTALGGRLLSIADLYALSASQVLDLVRTERGLPKRTRQAAVRILEALCDVGLGYLPLGQASPTLSGGEAQRVKLAKYLGKPNLAGSLLVLDEPSTGLHSQDVVGLLSVLDRLVRNGATIVVVEHSLDIVRAADWVIELGPGAGHAGGHLLYAGSPDRLPQVKGSQTAQALLQDGQTVPNPGGPDRQRQGDRAIVVRGARAHNLKGVNVEFPKGAITVVTGVSGSGKSSLVSDVLEAEARRRFLESLSLYERQSTREGPEAPVDELSGLGVAVAVGSERRLHDRRATVGTATEISHHLAVLLSCAGTRRCLGCGSSMRRASPSTGEEEWHCSVCGASAPVAKPRHFSRSNYAAACLACHGVGTLQVPNPTKLIVHPERPLCDGAMHSPGFFPKGYLCKPFNGGYDLLQALAVRHGFDPASTPWSAMTPDAQQAFLYGDSEPLQVVFTSRTQSHTAMATFPGFYGWVRDWDVGGTYTDAQPCPDCKGAGLRAEYLAVSLDGHNLHELSEMPLSSLAQMLSGLNLTEPGAELASSSLRTARLRLGFLLQVGLGYLNLERLPSTLSAGEAQRVKLAGLLGSGLTSLTVILDEPSRGLHPSEVDALLAALRQLQGEGNTVIVVEHDPAVIRKADHLIDMGPGAGVEGGEVVAQGKPEELARSDTLTGRWLRGDRHLRTRRPRREPRGWLSIRGARANNLCGEEVDLPLGALVGVCGVSGSGKSTLIVDTLGRALCPRKQTTSVALEVIDPGIHDAIEGAPARTILVDQTRVGVHSLVQFMDLLRPIHALCAASEDAQSLGMDEKELTGRCSACGGSGLVSTDMGFLPTVHTSCDICRGTGYRAEAWRVHVEGVALPELLSLTTDQVYTLLGHELTLARPLQAARDVGLGYLVLRQPGHALSGGEAQRLKIAKELSRKTVEDTLYILDEPTVGQHLEDVARLVDVLNRLVDAGHTVVVVEHHAHLLACCDWLVELGPGAGPDGGRVVASGTPETVAAAGTPTGQYLREVLQA